MKRFFAIVLCLFVLAETFAIAEAQTRRHKSRFGRKARTVAIIAGGVALVAALAYLRDPPWMGNVTSGMREWDYSDPRMVFRWTAGRASLFIPSDAKAVMIPLRSGIPGP